MRSKLLRTSDYHAVNLLSHECRDLGDDPVIWRMHYAEAISRLVHVDLALIVELDGLMVDLPCSAGASDWGWKRGFNPAGWGNACQLFAEDPYYNPVMNEFFARLRPTQGATFTRTDLISDDQWDRIPPRDSVYKLVGVDHHAYSFFSLAQDPTQHAGVMCFRGIGDRDYTEREKAMLNELQRVITPLVGRSLARFNEPSASALPPRVREVLRCLLEGDSDKQIATRLGIKPFTVNQYTKVIYRHYGVAGRAELLARWIRRRWNQQPIQ